jgi:hypothetical protein
MPYIVRYPGSARAWNLSGIKFLKCTGVRLVSVLDTSVHIARPPKSHSLFSRSARRHAHGGTGSIIPQKPPHPSSNKSSSVFDTRFTSADAGLFGFMVGTVMTIEIPPGKTNTGWLLQPWRQVMFKNFDWNGF